MKSRVENLFNILCREAEQISVEKFAEQHNVSSRTVYKDLSTLNQLLISQGHTSIQNTRGVLIYEAPIEIEFSELVKKDDIFYLDPEMRRRVILDLVILWAKEISISELQQVVGVSKNTIQRDLDEIKKNFIGSDICLDTTPFKGVSVTGNEFKIRGLFADYLTKDWPYLYAFISEQDAEKFNQIKNSIDEISNCLQVEYSENAQQKLIAYMLVSVARFKENKQLCLPRNIDKEDLLGSPEYGAVNKCIEQLKGLYGQEITENELYFLSAKFRESTVVGMSDYISENWIKLRILVSEFIDKMDQLVTESNFSNDDKLFESILNHLRPAYWRAVSGEAIYNPLLDYVINEFEDLYRATTESISVLEKGLSISFSEDEIAFLTMFFMASQERTKKPIELRPKVIVVCHAGVATSEIVSSRLESKYEVSVLGTFGSNEAQKWLESHSVDFVVSTFPFTSKNVKVVEVSPQFDLRDQRKIENILRVSERIISSDEIMSIVSQTVVLSKSDEEVLKRKFEEYLGFLPKHDKEERYFPMLEEVLTEDLVETHYCAKDSDDAVREAGRLLVKKGIAKEEYIEAMIENVQINGTYIVIAPGIAMPHARPEEGALGIGFSLITLDRPVNFGHPKNDPVQLVVALCAIDHQTHLNALADLAELLSDEENVQKILKADKAAEVIAITSRR